MIVSLTIARRVATWWKMLAGMTTGRLPLIVLRRRRWGMVPSTPALARSGAIWWTSPAPWCAVWSWPVATASVPVSADIDPKGATVLSRCFFHRRVAFSLFLRSFPKKLFVPQLRNPVGVVDKAALTQHDGQSRTYGSFERARPRVLRPWTRKTEAAVAGCCGGDRECCSSR
jgi:hypothetical protein